MEIFALDCALFKIVSNSLGGPGFLMHYSHLFDGVDPRQVAAALKIGHTLADAVQGQYIVTMNSDAFSKLSFPSEFNASAKCLPIVLDDSESGGLFGFRFD